MEQHYHEQLIKENNQYKGRDNSESSPKVFSFQILILRVIVQLIYNDDQFLSHVYFYKVKDYGHNYNNQQT